MKKRIIVPCYTKTLVLQQVLENLLKVNHIEEWTPIFCIDYSDKYKDVASIIKNTYLSKNKKIYIQSHHVGCDKNIYNSLKAHANLSNTISVLMTDDLLISKDSLEIVEQYYASKLYKKYQAIGQFNLDQNEICNDPSIFYEHDGFVNGCWSIPRYILNEYIQSKSSIDTGYDYSIHNFFKNRGYKSIYPAVNRLKHVGTGLHVTSEMEKNIYSKVYYDFNTQIDKPIQVIQPTK